MFERFTDRARQVVVLAQQEARELQHGYIGTEHILLGLLREQQGVAAVVLESLGLSLGGVRSEVIRQVGPGEAASSGQIPFTPRAKKVLELALRESLSLGHNYIGTEHILLGLARENEGVAAGILHDAGVDADKIRDAVLRVLSGSERPPEPQMPRVAERSPPRDPGEMFSRIERQIRVFLRREPDNGDLLVILASLPEGLVARTLAELGVDDASLDAALERARAAGPDDIEDQIALVRRHKDEAIDAGKLEDAARYREEERRLMRAGDIDLLGRIRDRLRLSPPPDVTSS